MNKLKEDYFSIEIPEDSNRWYSLNSKPDYIINKKVVWIIVFVSKRIKNHITTNLLALELKSIYSNCIRMREMINLVAFDRDSKGKRKQAKFLNP
jgi:hypothetical protein